MSREHVRAPKGKTSLIKQLVGEELKSGPELKCEAQIEAIQTRIEKTWLTELTDHEVKLEQALATKRLASLLASQIELQQLLLKQQQQQRVGPPAHTNHANGSFQEQSTSAHHCQPSGSSASSSSSRPVQNKSKCPSSSTSTSNSQLGRAAKADLAGDNKSVAARRDHQHEQQNSEANALADRNKNKCQQPAETTLDASNDRAGPAVTSAALHPSSLSSHQTQLTYHEKAEQQQQQQQLDRPTILISSSSAASSSTNLCEQNAELPLACQHQERRLSDFQATSPRESQSGDARVTREVPLEGRKGRELIDVTCTPTGNPAGQQNQQFNDGAKDQNQSRTGSKHSTSGAQLPPPPPPISANKFPLPSINQPSPLGHNQDDSSRSRGNSQQEQQLRELEAREPVEVANRPRAMGNANHVPDGKQQPPPKQRGEPRCSDKGNIRKREETINVDVGGGASAVDKVGTGQQQMIPVQSQHDEQEQREQLKPMRSLDVGGRKLTTTASAMAGSAGDGRNEAASALRTATKDFVASPAHHHHHRHSYCAPTSASSERATTAAAGGNSTRFAATKDELSTQARIINILFSNNKSASSSSSHNQQEASKSSGQEAATHSGGSSKPMLMPALLRQYQRRLSNFHSGHGSSNNSNQQQQREQQQQQQPEQSSSASKQTIALNGGAVIDRKSSIVQVMAELILAEQRRRARLVKEAASAAATLATSAAAAAQALLVARSPMINTSQFRLLMDDQRGSRLEGPGVGVDSVAEYDDERAIALERLPLPIFGGCQPSSWIRGSETLDEHGICHEANLYALTEEYRLKLANVPSHGVEPVATGQMRRPGAEPRHQPKINEQLEQTGSNGAAPAPANKQPVQLASDPANCLQLTRGSGQPHQQQPATRYDIKHFCANYIDNMNLYEIKIVDMPTIEPVSEFPTSSLLEWSLFKGRSHLLTADAYLLVFDLTRPSTIQYIKMLRDKIFESREMSNVPVYVIANKADLCPTLQPSLQARQMRNVAVHRHQASLNSSSGGGGGGEMSSAGGNVVASTGAGTDQRQALQARDQRTKSKWSLIGGGSGSSAKSGSAVAAAAASLPPPPTTFNLASEQRSVPAAAAHQLLAAYKMHRMRLGGTGPIVSLRRWAKLRRAVALNEPHSYAAGLSGYSCGTSFTGSSSAWSQFERKRMHYSLIIGASGGLDSRSAGAPAGMSGAGGGSGALGVALGRVRSCFRRIMRGTGKSRFDSQQASSARGSKSRRYRSRFGGTTRRFGSQPLGARRKRRKPQAARVRDHTELALIKGAKRRKSSIFVGAFGWTHATAHKSLANRRDDNDDDDDDEVGKSRSKKSKRKAAGKGATKRAAAKSARGKSVGAGTRRSNWSNWLHLSAPSELTQGKSTTAVADEPLATQSDGKKGGAGNWRASLGLKRKRASCSDAASLGSGGSNSRGILKLTKREQPNSPPHDSNCQVPQQQPQQQQQQQQSLDRLAVDKPAAHLSGSASTIHQQRDSNTETTTAEADLTLRQSDVTIDPSVVASPKRRLVEPLCGAMSTPASRQTFYDLFNRLLQTSSTTAAKTQLKLGAIQAADKQQKSASDGGAAAGGLNRGQSAASGLAAEGGQLLKIRLEEEEEQQTAADKKSKRRKSSSTGAALWQTLSSLALSRISSQSGDRKGSGQKLETTHENGLAQRSATVLGGRLSVTSRASGCSLSGSIILEDPQQQRQKRDSEDKETNRREAQANVLSSDGLKLGTDQYLSVDMLRKLSLISSHSQVSAGEEPGIEGLVAGSQLNGVAEDVAKRPKSAPSEPAAGVAQALRRASRVWLGGGGKNDKHKSKGPHEVDNEIEPDAEDHHTAARPHTSEPGASGTGAKRFWYRGVVKKILFHSNKQSLKGIVTAMELQRKADEELRAANSQESGQQANQEEGQQQQQQQQQSTSRSGNCDSSNNAARLVIDVTVQPEPSTSKTIEEENEPNDDEQEEEEENQVKQAASGQQPSRRQSLAVVQSAPAIRIISSGSSLSLLSENNASGSSDPSKQTSASPKQLSSSTSGRQGPLGAEKPANKDTLSENTQRDQESSAGSTATNKQTISASSSAGSLASSSASLSESVTLNIDASTVGATRTKAGLKVEDDEADRAETATGTADLAPDDDDDDDDGGGGGGGDQQADKSGRAGEQGEKSGSSSSDSDDEDEEEDEEEEDSSPLAGLGEPQLSYQLRKLSADDCLIINRHRRQSLAAMQDDHALSLLKNRSAESANKTGGNNEGLGETTGDNKGDGRAAGQTTGEQPVAPTPERPATTEEGRRQSIKQSIEAAIHLLVPRAKARSASITLGATDCERRSRSQLGTAIMGAVNVHKTWRDWRQLLGRKKSTAATNREGGGGGAFGNLCDKVIAANGGMGRSPTGGPSFAFSGGHLLSDSFSTNGAAPPPIVGFLSSHVAYKKLSADQQREAAINFDQLMRINQLTLTAANVVMLAASQPPIRQPLSTREPGRSHPSQAGGKKQGRHHHHNHHHPHRHLKGVGQADLSEARQHIPLIGPAEVMEDGAREGAPVALESRLRASLEAENCELAKRKSSAKSGGRGKHHQQDTSSGAPTTGLQPLMTRIQSGGNLLLRKSSLGGDKSSRAKRKAAKAQQQQHDESKQNASGTMAPLQPQDDLFGPLALLGGAESMCLDPSQAADLLRVQSALGEDSGANAASAAAAAAAAAASSQATPAEGDISARIAAAAASALERQRRRGERLSAILEPRYDKKQPGAEYPIFVSHDLNPILKDLAQLVRKHWKCNYIECSAASNWNIRPIISELTRALECNNRLSTSSSGISVGDDYSERNRRMHSRPNRPDRVFDDENSQSDEIWSNGGRGGGGDDDDDDDDDDDYRLGGDDDDDSALSSRDESSFDFISSDESDTDSGMNADHIRTLDGDGRPSRTKRSARVGRNQSKRRSSSNGQATKCAIM